MQLVYILTRQKCRILLCKSRLHLCKLLTLPGIKRGEEKMMLEMLRFRKRPSSSTSSRSLERQCRQNSRLAMPITRRQYPAGKAHKRARKVVGKPTALGKGCPSMRLRATCQPSGLNDKVLQILGEFRLASSFPQSCQRFAFPRRTAIAAIVRRTPTRSTLIAASCFATEFGLRAF